MKVSEIMTAPVQWCGPDDNLAEAAAKMWDSDCGILPVVNQDGKVIGLITDRDICMAAATNSRVASAISVWETSSGRVFSCRPQDDVRTALKTMAEHRVRRLPVVDEEGLLKGMLSLNDVILRAAPAPAEISYEDVIATLKAISSHRVLAAT